MQRQLPHRRRFRATAPVRKYSVAIAGLPNHVKLWLEQSRMMLRSASLTSTRVNAGAGIFEKSLNRPTMALRFASSSFQSRGRFVEDFCELFRIELLRTRCKFSTVICNGKQRIPQFVREPPHASSRQAATRSVCSSRSPLHRKRPRHVVERNPQLTDLIDAAHIDTCFPAPSGDFSRTPRRAPETGLVIRAATHKLTSNPISNAAPPATTTEVAKMPIPQQHQLQPRAPHQQNAKQLVVAPRQWHRMKRFRRACVGTPVDRLHYALRLLTNS